MHQPPRHSPFKSLLTASTPSPPLPLILSLLSPQNEREGALRVPKTPVNIGLFSHF